MEHCNRSKGGIEVSLKDGLKMLYENGGKLTSDGLEQDEYMKYVPNVGICYEDNCMIGRNPSLAHSILRSIGWVKDKKFFYHAEQN
jgi:hypothetical protein